MSQQPVGPQRKALLEAYIACCKRSARRIVVAGEVANGCFVCAGDLQRNGYKTKHIAAAIRKRGFAAYAEARIKLVLAQSKYQAELDGHLWLT